MRLGTLIGTLTSERLEKVSRMVVPGWAETSSPLWAHNVESVLRETGQVEHTLSARRPPVLALFIALLEAPGYSAPIEDLREPVTQLTMRWARQVSRGELFGKNSSVNIYRRLLTAAWQDDLTLDASEAALLGLLRRELGMTRPQHYLMAHHSAIQPFWREGDFVSRLVGVLQDYGILYTVEQALVLPEELVPHVRRALGIEMSRGAATRLFGQLPNHQLRDALEELQLALAGSKSDRVERLVEHLVPASRVLGEGGVSDLRELARGSGCRAGGAKDELVSRIIAHFDAELDLVDPASEEPEPEEEPKALDRASFSRLLEALKGHQLQSIAMRLEVPHSGPKQRKIDALWRSHYCEASVLSALRNAELAVLLSDVNISARRSKQDRIACLVSHYGSGASPA